MHRLCLALLTIAAQAQLPHGAITADALRGHVSFLASDALEGRNSPSKGLDIAAEYIASRFRSLGLKPMGDDGYFQTAEWTRSQVNPAGFELTIESGGQRYEIPYSQVSLDAAPATSLDNVAMVRFTLEEAANATDDQLRGKALLVNLPPLDRPVMQRFGTLRRRLQQLSPAALIVIAEGNVPVSRGGGALRSLADTPLLPIVIVRRPELASLQDAKLTLKLAAATEIPAKMRNVAALLEGTDLKDQVVIVSAHYDHLGLATSGKDTVFNGANDNASGVAGVLEVAAALAKQKLRRSVLFLTFFAEEKGLLGARHYTLHPLVPLAQTVADLNFEQLGRTDSNSGPSEGPNLDMVNLTGFDFSDLKTTLAAAGALTGIRLVKHEKNSDVFFSASDNQPFADKCVVAHTVSVTYEFPDYHQPGDEWQKLDYDNMAKVVRMLGTGVYLLADQSSRPAYDVDNPVTAAYRSCAPGH